MSQDSGNSPLHVFVRTILWANAAGVAQLIFTKWMPAATDSNETSTRILVIMAAFVVPQVWCVARSIWVGGGTNGVVAATAVIVPWVLSFVLFGKQIKTAYSKATDAIGGPSATLEMQDIAKPFDETRSASRQ
jgi:hypothetical protein